MSKTTAFLSIPLLVVLLATCPFSEGTLDRAGIEQRTVSTAALNSEVRGFLAQEIAAHFGDIKTMKLPPDRVFNALTVGEFSWESFARALAAQADLGGSTTIAGKDSARAIAEMGLYESRGREGISAALFDARVAPLRHRSLEERSLAEHKRCRAEGVAGPSRFRTVLR
jgi:hypothetical protein